MGVKIKSNKKVTLNSDQYLAMTRILEWQIRALDSMQKRIPLFRMSLIQTHGIDEMTATKFTNDIFKWVETRQDMLRSDIEMRRGLIDSIGDCE